MRKFDYSFLNNGFLPASLVNLTSSIAALRTMAGVHREEHLRIFSELEAVAKIQSVKSSMTNVLTAFSCQRTFVIFYLLNSDITGGVVHNYAFSCIHRYIGCR